MIRMIRGVFGLPVNGIVKAMDKNSGAFEAGTEQEERLVRLGLAVKVEDGDNTATHVETVDTTAPIGFDETPPADFSEAEAVEEPVDLKSLTAKELRELGKEYGLSFKATDKKVDMIQAITEAQAEAVVHDGEPAPVFDAAEAVQ